MIYINETGKQNEVWLPKPYDTAGECPECPESASTWNSGYTSGWTDGVASVVCPDCDDAFNSGYTSGWTDGVASVVCPDCDDAYNSGYTSGRTDGYEDGFDEGHASGVTDGWEPAYNSGYTDGANSVDCSAEYDRGYDDGWVDGRVEGYNDGWPAGYTSGYTDGVNASGGDYASGYTAGFGQGYTSGHTDGYDEGFRDGQQDGYIGGFDDGHASGVTDGIAEQLAKLSADTFTQNGTYTRADGWSSVTVNVAQTGYTQQDLENAFNSGWTNGYNSGHTDGLSGCTGETLCGYLVAEYNVTSTTDPTKLVDVNVGIVKAELEDGTDIVFVPVPGGAGGSAYTFSATGIQKVLYITSGDITYDGVTYRDLVREQFQNVDQLVSVIVPPCIECLDFACFGFCDSLTSVTIPDSVVMIGGDAFRGCSALRNVTIPSSVTDIYGWAFQGDSGLTRMTFLGTTPPVLHGDYTLGSTTYTFPIYVPAAAVNTYKTAWPNYASRIQANPNN